MLLGTPALISIRLLLDLDEEDAASVIAEDIVEALLLVAKDGLRSGSSGGSGTSFCGTFIAEGDGLLADTSDRTKIQSSCFTVPVESRDIASCDVASILTCQVAVKEADCGKSSEVPGDGLRLLGLSSTTVSEANASDLDFPSSASFSCDD